MDILTKLSFSVMFSIAWFSVLTFPRVLKMFIGYGLKYPLWLILICAFISSILTVITIKWIEKKVLNKNNKK